MMLLSSVLFTAMAVGVRGLSSVNSYTVIMARFLVGAVAVGVMFVCGLGRMRWNNWPWIVARGVSGGLAVAAHFWAIQHIGLSKGVLLLYTSVVFAALFAVPLLGEQIRATHWGAIAAAMLGVVLLCGTRRLAIEPGDLIGLASGILSGFAYVTVTKCRETDTPSNIFWSQCLFGVAIVAWPTAVHWEPPTPREWLMLLTIGAVAMCGQLAMTYAYKYTGAAYGSLLGLFTPVASALIGVLYFREPLSAGFLVGGALVLVSSLYLSLHPIQRRAPAAAAGGALPTTSAVEEAAR